MWHVSSRSGVATLRTAIHLLLTFLTYLTTLPFHDVYRGTVSLLRPRYRRAEYCDERVRVSLCVSVCLPASISPESRVQTSPNCVQYL